MTVLKDYPLKLRRTSIIDVYTIVIRKSIMIRHSGAMRSIEPGISRFRVRVFDAPRNDGAEAVNSGEKSQQSSYFTRATLYP